MKLLAHHLLWAANLQRSQYGQGGGNLGNMQQGLGIIPTLFGLQQNQGAQAICDLVVRGSRPREQQPLDRKCATYTLSSFSSLVVAQAFSY